jgi:signal transduction histidine kinase
MSHELRTPLNSIIGFSAILRDAAATTRPDRLQKFAENIHIAGNHLLRLINDILDLSKVEAGRLELQPEEFDLREAVASVERVVKGICAEASVVLLTSIDETLPAVVLDEARTKQILLNLLSNAVKFSTQGGFVRLRVEHVPAERSLIGTDSVSLVVSDQGIGMPPEELPKIFDQFYQIERHGVLRRRGTGLGLSLTKGFIELHGGRITVESEIDRGSTFSVTLPIDCRASKPKNETYASGEIAGSPV